MNKYLWSAAKGMYEDYQFAEGRGSDYDYVTTFYPLWAGMASVEQAAAVRGHLGAFDHEGGLAMSTTVSGVQWDLPFGWAPTNWLAVSGLARYGYREDAVRVAEKFMATVRANFLLGWDDPGEVQRGERVSECGGGGGLQEQCGGVRVDEWGVRDDGGVGGRRGAVREVVGDSGPGGRVA